jgi:hypothetical protein
MRLLHGYAAIDHRYSSAQMHDDARHSTPCTLDTNEFQDSIRES